MSWVSVSIPNVPDWQEDGNSPFTASGATSLSGSLSSTGHDQYLIVVNHLDHDASSTTTGDWTMTINGSTGTYYDYWESDGTSTVDASSVTLAASVGKNQPVAGVIHAFSNTGPDMVTGPCGLGASQAPVTATSWTHSVETDITSFTMDNSAGAVTGTVEVYYRDV